jgi:hypothetical protein
MSRGLRIELNLSLKLKQMSTLDPTQMDDITKLLHIKEQVMEVKLQLTKLAIQKEEVIRSQRYEQAADIRIEEKRLTNLLLDQRLMLIKQQASLPPIAYNIKLKAICQEILTEISTLEELKSMYRELFNDFRSQLQADCKHLSELVKELSAQQQFKEANYLREHLHQIGVFLANNT